MEAFVERLLTTLLPAKCGLAPDPPAADGTAAAAPAAAAAPETSSSSSPAGVEAAVVPAPAPAPAAAPAAAARTEFGVAVEELAKAKLEKPKKLGGSRGG